MFKLLLQRIKLYKFYKQDAAYIRKHKAINELYKNRIRKLEQEIYMDEQRHYYRQSVFMFCKCGNELWSSDSFEREEDDKFYFKCSRCRRRSVFDSSIAPVPILEEMED